MKVLAIGNRYPPAATGGYERIWKASMDALEAAGHAVRVLTPPELDWNWRAGAWVRLGRAARRRNLRVLAAVVEDFAPDVVSWWGMGGMQLSLIEAVRDAGLPSVGVVGDGWMVYGPEVDRSSVDLGPGVRWLFISEATRERSAELHELPSTGLAHPGVDPAVFPPAPDRPWSGELACIGRVEPRKGVDVAVRALAELPGMRLTVNGPDEGGHVAELQALAASLGVAVEFVQSPSGDVASAYAAADAVLFGVTWPEPWGLVPLEAMSVGRPVVATGTGGSAEYLRDGDNCLLAKAGDAPAMAAAVRRLATSAELRSSLRGGGFATAARYPAAGFTAQVLAELETAASR